MAELDEDFAGYAAMVKRRTGLKDRHIAEGWMRGQGGPAPMRPDELPRIAGPTDVFLRLEGATLSIALDPTDLDAMRPFRTIRVSNGRQIRISTSTSSAGRAVILRAYKRERPSAPMLATGKQFTVFRADIDALAAALVEAGAALDRMPD